MTYTVYGTPAPQGSKKHVGNGIMVESSKQVKPWREAIVWQVKPQAMIDGPVEVSIIFTLNKPKSAPKARTTYPDRKPDLDKLVRSTFDGLKSAGVYRDDSQVIWLAAAKRFPGEGIDALDRPGAVIRVRRIEA